MFDAQSDYTFFIFLFFWNYSVNLFYCPEKLTEGKKLYLNQKKRVSGTLFYYFLFSLSKSFFIHYLLLMDAFFLLLNFETH